MVSNIFTERCMLSEEKIWKLQCYGSLYFFYSYIIYNVFFTINIILRYYTRVIYEYIKAKSFTHNFLYVFSLRIQLYFILLSRIMFEHRVSFWRLFNIWNCWYTLCVLIHLNIWFAEKLVWIAVWVLDNILIYLLVCLFVIISYYCWCINATSTVVRESKRISIKLELHCN